MYSKPLISLYFNSNAFDLLVLLAITQKYFLPAASRFLRFKSPSPNTTVPWMTSFLLATLFNRTLTQRLLLKPWNLLATSVLLNFSSSSFLQILDTVPHSLILSYLLCCAVLSRWVMSNSLQPHVTPMAPLSIGILPGKNTGVGCLALLQGTFPTQGSNPGLPHWEWIRYRLSYQGSPSYLLLCLYYFTVSYPSYFSNYMINSLRQESYMYVSRIPPSIW